MWSWKRAELEGEQTKNISFFEVGADGKTIVYVYSTASKLPQIYRAQLDGTNVTSPVQVTKLNESLIKGRTFAKAEVIRWKGANNEEVEGILYYPDNYEAGKKYPLITAIHGGPSGHDADAWADSWAYPNNLLTQRGAFVLKPNYHGSNNYGLKWVESICCGKYYDLETPDINAGVDFLIAKGLVDADRVATMGWSNGSILSTSLITTYPARYKVASVGAGDVEWISDWGNVMFGDSFDSYYFGKSPMEDPELYIRKSPFFKMDKVQAPVLIFHGTADTNVPPAQSWSYFRALQYYEKVPVKFVVFPGEPHGPRKLTHQMRKVEEEVAWFDKYFFKTAKPENDAIKKDSPIESALRGVSIAQVRGRYGVEAGRRDKEDIPFVVPEVVQRSGLEIGRFEVTGAQWSQFELRRDKRAPDTTACVIRQFDLAEINRPVAGISLEKAQEYVTWLKQGHRPTLAAAVRRRSEGSICKARGRKYFGLLGWICAESGGCGVASAKAKELKGLAPLVKEVGSFRGQGKEDEEPIYDLGGNVAEWVLTRDGKGKVIGGSADCPADPKSNCTPAPEYIGFRVVRGPAKPVPAASASTP